MRTRSNDDDPQIDDFEPVDMTPDPLISQVFEREEPMLVFPAERDDVDEWRIVR